jgi:hypothetical protein
MIVLSGVFGIEWAGQLANPVVARVRGGNLRQCECRNQSEYPRVQLLVHCASSFTGRSENRPDRAFRFRSADAKAAREAMELITIARVVFIIPFTITVFPADSYGILFFVDTEITRIGKTTGPD